MCSFVSGFFLSTCFWDSSMWLYVSVVHSLLLMNTILLYKYTKICLSIIQRVYIWVVSSLGLFIASKIARNILVHTFFFFCNMFLFLLGKTPRKGTKYFLNVFELQILSPLCFNFSSLLAPLPHYTMLYINYLDLSPGSLSSPTISTLLLITYTKLSFQWLYFHFQDFSFIPFLSLLGIFK